MIPDAQLHYVDSVDSAGEFLRWLGERRPVLALDTETSGFHWAAGDVLRMVQFGDGACGWALSYRQWRGVIEQALRSYSGPYVLHNSSFDLHFLERAGLPLPGAERVHDTMILDTLIDPLRSHALKALAERQHPGSTAGQALLQDALHKNKWTWATVPEDFEIYWAYAALDTVLTARIYEDLWPKVQPYRAAYEREMAALSVLYRAEERGIRIDTVHTANLLAEWTQEADQLFAELNTLGLENPNSGRQIAQAMQVTEKWEPDEWTDTGMPKVDAAVLKGIDSEISRRVLRYRRLTKWNSAYLASFLAKKDHADRVHPNIRTMQARTGRMSITSPALQTLPRKSEIKQCIIPSEGKVFWEIDYSNQEARIFTHFSQDAGLISALKDGADFHLFTAQQVYSDPSITADDPRRQMAKNINFAKIYGAGAAKIALTAGVSVQEVERFLSEYNQSFPGVATFMQNIDSVARNRLINDGRPYVRTWGGRDVVSSPNKIYSLVNYLIQGSASDVLKEKIVEIDANGYGDAIVVPVHDSLLFEFDEGDTESPRICAEIMTCPDEFSVPLPVDVSGPGKTWKEVK